eukprot:Ihof_evm9s14 gene=Ihof_evmTU9s14
MATSQQFRVPTKQIYRVGDVHGKWINSEGYKKLTTFVALLNESVTGLAISQCPPPSPAIQRMMLLLDQLDRWIDDIPRVEQPMRFGNRAFKTWLAQLEMESGMLISQLLPPDQQGAVIELGPYLVESFGNSTRIDYGTGHEVNFIAFLCCLYVMGILDANDQKALVLMVFVRYLSLVRKLQQTYNMEPAGSHGVWGLDDYQFLPFYFGSSQLIGHPHLKPRDFPNPSICDKFSNEYLFMSAVQYIHRVKKGPFGEHSPLLWDISALQQWEKAN